MKKKNEKGERERDKESKLQAKGIEERHFVLFIAFDSVEIVLAALI